MEEQGKTRVASFSPELDRDLRARQERAWETVERVQDRNAAISPEEVLADVTAEVEAVRQERYEQRAAATKSSR